MRTTKTKIVFLLCVLLQCVTHLSAQSVKMTGSVVDQQSGTPLSNVMIHVKNGTALAETDSLGHFTITAPSAESVLSFSLVGYKIYETQAGNRSLLNVHLGRIDDKLDDVVVVGYGTQKASNVTGAIVTADMKQLSDMPVRTLSEALKGQIPGLNISGGNNRPGVNATATVRQTVAWNNTASTNPMVVIDDVIQLDPETGQPSLDQFNRLDPSEVESISVIKDGAAAIYGAKASQGAIIVKTKRGKAGAARVSYSGKFELDNSVGFVKTMSAYEYGVFSNRYGRAAGDWPSTSFFSDAELNSMRSLNYDWLNQAWKSAGQMQHSVNVSGGSDRATYFAGISYFKQGANLGNQDYNRWTFRTGTDVKVSDNVKLSATVSANNDDNELSFTKVTISDGSYGAGSEQTDYSLLAHMPKYIPWQYDVNGVTQYVSPALGANKVAGKPDGQNNISGWNYFNLLNNGSKTTFSNTNYAANFSLEYNVPFIKGLSVKGSYGITSTVNNSEQDMLPQPLALATNTNAIDHHLYTDSSTWKVATNKQGARIVYSDHIGKVQQMNLFLTYANSFGKHNISAMGSLEKGKQDGMYKFVIYDNPTAGYNGASSTAGTLNTSNSYVNRFALGSLAYLGRVSYDYDGKYLAQFVFRSDASTKFSPQNYWGFFPGFSAGWVISKEDWFRDALPWVNYLKLRASIAKVGFDNVQAWRWEQVYGLATDKGLGFGPNGGLLGNGVSPNTTPNPDIKWDQNIQHNIGLDMTVLNGRLNFTVDQYFNNRSNILMSLASATGTPISAGGAFAEQNYGAINEWGTEISASWKDNIGEVSYRIGMNWGTSGNKIKKYPDAPFNYPSTNTMREGVSTIFPAWGFEVWRGTASGDGMMRTQADIDAYWNYLTDLATKAGTTPLYLNLDKSGIKPGMLAYKDLAGNLNTNDNTIAGPNGRVSKSEDYAKLVKVNRTQSINTNLSFGWKTLSLDAQIATSWGGFNQINYIKQGTSAGQMFWAHESFMTDMFDPTDNPNGKYPNLAYYDQNGAPSDFWQISSFRSYVRSLVIGYTLPKTIAKSLHMDNLKVSFAGYNLWDFYNPYPNKYRTMYDDPQVGYPTLRTWSFGINASF